MKLFGKIEDLLNLLIIKVGGLFKKLIPSFIKNFFSSISSKIKVVFSVIGGKLSIIFSKLFAGAKFLPNKIHALVTLLIGMLIQAGQKLKGGAVSFQAVKRLFAPIAIFLGSLALKIKKWYLSLKPTTVAIGIVSSATVGIAALNIYSSGRQIYDKSQEEPKIVNVEPSSIRAEYYKQSEKHLNVDGVTVPIYVGTGNAPKTLILDFTLLMSNRYLKSYFYENDYLLKDRLNTHFEPVVPTLPLEDEGKRIIKEKIIKELNILIKDLKIKGEVEDVYFHTIING